MEPMPDHKVQVSIYFKAFNDHLAKGDFDHIPGLAGVKEAVGVKVIYLNKNNSELKLFKMRATLLNKIGDLIDEKVKKADEYIKDRKLPPKTPDKCSYCSWSKSCKKDLNPLDKGPKLI